MMASERAREWLEHTAGRPQELSTKWLEHTAGRPQELSTVAAARLLEPGGGAAWFVHAAAQAAEVLTADACLGLGVAGAHRGEAAGARHCGSSHGHVSD